MKIISGPLQINAIGKQAVGKQLIRRAVNLPDRKKNRLTTPDILLLMTQVGPYNTYDYPFNLEPIGENGEGDYLISFPDLPCCIAIGKDPGDAVEKDGERAEIWIKLARQYGQKNPLPSKQG